MTFTIFSADCIGNPGNCSYPHKCEITDAASLANAVAHDYVCAEYKGSYRSNDNFLNSDCLPMECDNDHSMIRGTGKHRQISPPRFPAYPLPSITAVTT